MTKLQTSMVMLSVIIGGAIGLTSIAQAQIEEITITATKREASLQDVPIAVTAVSGEELNLANISDINDLQITAPSLYISTTNTPSVSTTIRIRGVGTTGNNVGLEGAVGVFLDGVYRSRAGIALGDLIDIERIEILRGPQGTLFGKNTSAGAISVVTKAPSNEYEGYGEVMVGNHDALKIKGMMNLPLIDDKLALRFSGATSERDGFLEDVVNGRTYNDRDRRTFKGQLLWTLNDDINIRVIADYAEADEHCCQTVRVFNGPTAPAVSAFALGSGNAFFSPPNPGAFKTSIDGPVFNEFRDRGFSVELNWDIGIGTLTSITSDRSFDSTTNNDVDFTGARILNQLTIFNNEQFSEELRVAGQIEGGGFLQSIDWLIGGYYSDEKFLRDNRPTFGADTDGYATLISGGSLAGVYLAGTGTSGIWHQEGDSKSVFGHVTFTLDDQWALTGGIRWNSDEKEGDGTLSVTHLATGPVLGALFPFLPPQHDYVASTSEEELSGTINLQYNWNDDIMTYVSYSRGYKAGGINLDRSAAGSLNAAIPVIAITSDPANLPYVAGTYATIPCGARGGAYLFTAVVGVAQEFYGCSPKDATFSPEFADSYEIGIRSSWFDHRLNFNVTAFYSLFEDFQLNTFDGLAFNIENVSGASTRGIEAEYVFRPIEGLSITGGVNWVEARYDDDVGPPSPADPPLGGKVLTNAPQFTGSTAITYERGLANTDLIWYSRAEMFMSTGRETGSDLDPAKHVGGRQIYNGRLGLRNDDTGWDLSVWCRNCLDKRYTTVIFDSVAQSGSYDAFIGNPMEWGLSASMRF